MERGQELQVEKKNIRKGMNKETEECSDHRSTWLWEKSERAVLIAITQET